MGPADNNLGNLGEISQHLTWGKPHFVATFKQNEALYYKENINIKLTIVFTGTWHYLFIFSLWSNSLVRLWCRERTKIVKSIFKLETLDTEPFLITAELQQSLKKRKIFHGKRFCCLTNASPTTEKKFFEVYLHILFWGKHFLKRSINGIEVWFFICSTHLETLPFLCLH